MDLNLVLAICKGLAAVVGLVSSYRAVFGETTADQKRRAARRVFASAGFAFTIILIETVKDEADARSATRAQELATSRHSVLLTRSEQLTDSLAHLRALGESTLVQEHLQLDRMKALRAGLAGVAGGIRTATDTLGSLVSSQHQARLDIIRAYYPISVPFVEGTIRFAFQSQFDSAYASRVRKLVTVEVERLVARTPPTTARPQIGPTEVRISQAQVFGRFSPFDPPAVRVVDSIILWPESPWFPDSQSNSLQLAPGFHSQFFDVSLLIVDSASGIERDDTRFRVQAPSYASGGLRAQRAGAAAEAKVTIDYVNGAIRKSFWTGLVARTRPIGRLASLLDLPGTICEVRWRDSSSFTIERLSFRFEDGAGRVLELSEPRFEKRYVQRDVQGFPEGWTIFRTVLTLHDIEQISGEFSQYLPSSDRE